MTEPKAFQSFICDEMATGKYRILLPTTDPTMRLVSQIRDFLAPPLRLPIPTEESVEQAQDKRRVLLLAQQLGIACPETFMLQETDLLPAAAARLRYPAVIKPRFSCLLRNGVWSFGNVQYVYGPQDLTDKYQKAHARIPYPLVQEKIDGHGLGVFILTWNGQLMAASLHRRLREKPPWGGVSVYRETIPLNQELVHKSFELLQAIGWQGPAMVEFIMDRRDGQAKLMEVNGRFWGSLQLAIDAGMNFPLLLYRLATEEKASPQFEYKAGVKSRWLLGDLDHLLIRLTHSGKANGFRRYDTSRLRECVNFMKFYEPDMYYEVFRFGDPGPGWCECKLYIRELMRGFLSQKEKVSAR